MKIISQDLLPFDMQYPVYNFFYPHSGRVVSESESGDLLRIANDKAKKRALYVHIPFCDTICSFCPFTRGRIKESSVIEDYVQALIREIELKSALFGLGRVAVNAVFFGGGTPSMMSAGQIVRVGDALRRCFDFSSIKEFSFEIEVKSLTLEKVLAMQGIGVTHPRFGLQTFSKKWRGIFTLTASLEQVYSSIEMLSKSFENVSFDILYGMSGHSEEELIADLKMACDSGVSNIDVYPIDNVMTQPALHRALKDRGYTPTSAARKFSMNILVDCYMRSRGYMPHNGHGYRRVGAENVTTDVVYPSYQFEYHEHVYGYHDHDLIGFGVSAISSLFGMKIINTSNRNKYISHYGGKGDGRRGPVFEITKFTHSLNYLRPLALRLPYFGSVEKSRLDTRVLEAEGREKLELLKAAGLLVETDSCLRLSKSGWYNYVNMMYYLMPQVEQQAMDGMIADQLAGNGRDITEGEVLFKTVDL